MRRPSNGTLLISTGILLPVLLWLLLISHDVTLNNLGRVFGLAAISALSINIILSARIKIFDRLFLGLDRMYRIHHTLGCITFLLVLTHFDLILLSYAQLSSELAYNFLADTSHLYRVAAKVAFLLLFSGIVVVLYFKVKYKLFITMQRIMGAAIFFAGYHALFIPGNSLRTEPILFAYMILLGGTAASLYIYRSIFHRPLNKRLDYTITKVTPKGKVTEVHLKPDATPMQYYAGQYAFISFRSARVAPEVHPFSISAPSSSGELRFSMKASGDFTKTLPQLKVGEKAKVEGPFGQFSFTKIKGENQVWIAGGIGITPFLSMAGSLPPSLSVDLYYSVMTKAEAIYLDELEADSTRSKLRVHPNYSDIDGLLTADKIMPKVKADTQILLCGPKPMMDSLEAQFRKLGVAKEQIHYEEFALS